MLINHNLNKDIIDSFINSLFIEKNFLTQDCEDFYQMFLYSKNKDILIKQIKLLFEKE